MKNKIFTSFSLKTQQIIKNIKTIFYKFIGCKTKMNKRLNNNIIFWGTQYPIDGNKIEYKQYQLYEIFNKINLKTIIRKEHWVDKTDVEILKGYEK